jgi:hypothetical protein
LLVSCGLRTVDLGGHGSGGSSGSSDDRDGGKQQTDSGITFPVDVDAGAQTDSGITFPVDVDASGQTDSGITFPVDVDAGGQTDSGITFPVDVDAGDSSPLPEDGGVRICIPQSISVGSCQDYVTLQFYATRLCSEQGASTADFIQFGPPGGCGVNQSESVFFNCCQPVFQTDAGASQ